jgi:hypothetical protein
MPVCLSGVSISSYRVVGGGGTHLCPILSLAFPVSPAALLCITHLTSYSNSHPFCVAWLNARDEERVVPDNKKDNQHCDFMWHHHLFDEEVGKLIWHDRDVWLVS